MSIMCFAISILQRNLSLVLLLSRMIPVCIFMLGAFGIFLHDVYDSFWTLRRFLRTVSAPFSKVDFTDGFIGTTKS